jgi:hypothetical protein
MSDVMLTYLYKKLFTCEAQLDKLQSDMSGIEDMCKGYEKDKIRLITQLDLLSELITVRTDQIGDEGFNSGVRSTK